MREKQFQGAPKKYKGRNKRHCFEVALTVFEGDVKRTEVFSSLAKARKILRTLPFATLSFCYVKYRKDSWGVKRSWYGISRFGEIAKYHDRRQWLKVLYELNLDKEEIKILEKAAEKMQEYLNQKPSDIIIEPEPANKVLMEDIKCLLCGEKLNEVNVRFFQGRPIWAEARCGGDNLNGRCFAKQPPRAILKWDEEVGIFRLHEYDKTRFEYGIRLSTRKRYGK